MLISGEIFVDQVDQSCNSLPRVLMDRYGIKSALFSTKTDTAAIVNAIRASLDKPCCDKHYRVIVADPSERQMDVVERTLQELMGPRAQRSKCLEFIVVSAVGKLVTAEQLDQIRREHNDSAPQKFGSKKAKTDGLIKLN